MTCIDSMTYLGPLPGHESDIAADLIHSVGKIQKCLQMWEECGDKPAFLLKIRHPKVDDSTKCLMKLWDDFLFCMILLSFCQKFKQWRVSKLWSKHPHRVLTFNQIWSIFTNQEVNTMPCVDIMIHNITTCCGSWQYGYALTFM